MVVEQDTATPLNAGQEQELVQVLVEALAMESFERATPLSLSVAPSMDVHAQVSAAKRRRDRAESWVR